MEFGFMEQTLTQLDVTVVLPAYNEAGHIGQEVERIGAALRASPYSFEILVVDDGSTDDTSEVVRAMPHVRLIRFRSNRGSGTARRVGTSEARGRWVVWTDADMTYPNEFIPELVDVLAAGGVDQVIGARTSEQGTTKFFRVPAKWAIKRLAEYLTSTKIPDLNTGLRAFRKDVALPYLGLLPTGFSCTSTMTLAFLSNDHAVEFVDVDYHPRAGKSHFHPVKDAYRYILQVVRMVTFFEPLRVFGPLALTMLLLGTGKVIYDIARPPTWTVTGNTIVLLLTGMFFFSIGLLADLIVRSSRNLHARAVESDRDRPA